MSFRRSPFRDVVARQLDLFLAEHDELARDCEAALARYEAADREDAEELYGDYLDLVETGAEELAAMRDTYARTLDDAQAVRYEQEFNRAAGRRARPFGDEVERQ